MNDIAPSPFIAGTKLQTAWDSTSLGWLKLCPRLYQYSMIEGWRSKSTKIDLAFGIEYHWGIEHYDKQRLLGQSHDEATRFVVSEVLKRTYKHPDFEGSEDSNKNRPTLIRSLVWYFEEFQNDNAKTITLANGKPAVELSFRLNLDYGPEYLEATENPQPYILCGHIDRLVEFTGQVFVQDHKAQPITSKVLGPNGWIEIGNLNVGDLIAHSSGEFVEVIELFPKGETEVYSITFNDRTTVKCGKDHLWYVSTQGAKTPFEVLSFEELYSRMKKFSTNKYFVPKVRPIQHPKRILPIDPYIMGALLGDGILGGGSIQLSATKQHVIEKFMSRLPDDCIMKKASEFNNSWTISGKNFRDNSILNSIKRLGLKDAKADTKFIPDIYLYASEEQRRDLLDGLLDTDGGFSVGNRIFDSTSIDLIFGICEIVRSLGGNARYHSRTGTNLQAFRAWLRLPEWKSGTKRRYITDVKRVENEKTICISVNAKDGLYVTDYHVVTHNTTKTTLSSSYFAQFEPDNQMTLYTVASQIVFSTLAKGVMIDAAQIAVGFTRFERGVTFRTEAQLEEWLHDLQILLRQNEEYVKNDYWPMNDKSCRMCQFKKICSKDPKVRDIFLASEFSKSEWNPLKIR